MSDLTKLKEILDHQSPKGVKSGDWHKLEYTQRKNADDGYGVTMAIDNIQIGFVFNRKGRLVGMYNWKE
jgi:hypothetical protein